jgi:tetratricopeptide (TPR) repeat protein
MTISTHLSRIGAAAALLAALSACSTAPKVPATPQLQDLLSEAGKAAAGGNKEQAVTLWKQSAALFPAEKAPWSHIAQTRYEAGQYGDAIQAALEVLVRDPNDKLANSIIAISGLRLSTRALNDLSRQNNLSGSLKNESQELAKLLRESLGETTLFSAAQTVQPAKERERERERDVAPKAKVAKKGKAAAKPAGEATASNNPFGSLLK